MCVSSVGNPLAKELLSLDTREFTPVKGFMSVGNVGKLLDPNPNLIGTIEVTLEKGLMNALNVGNLLDKATASLNTSEFTVEQGLEPGSLAQVHALLTVLCHVTLVHEMKPAGRSVPAFLHVTRGFNWKATL